MNHAATAVDTQCINTLRTLAMDAVQKANSGHPGTPITHDSIGVGEDGPTHQPIEHLTQLQEKYGFTVENVVKLAKQQIQLNGH
ncbi:transketolase [Pseudomonas marginalis]|uniref:hypothetical protein n=1 Tax=Pseudomonas TaxID=286 RepID=UPI0020A0453E|nr:transketolase [Pseudomonas marginalis]MCP1523717.1 transketolase [Pseudomonas marginalis]MDQ0502467.1 transketolase [Pseudomonas marginalis]